MAAPTDADLKYYPGASGTPTDDTSAIGGAIATGTEIVEGTVNTLIHTVTISGSAVDYYGVAYRKNEATGTLNTGKCYLRTGGNVAPSAGVVTVVSTSASDVSNLWIAYKSGSSWISAGETITLAGLTPVNGLTTVDSGSDWVAIYNSGAVPVGDITIKINSVQVGMIYGSAGGNGNYCASTLYTLALASSASSTLSAANRLTAPGSIGSFTAATYWPGNDSSVAIPGTNLATTAYFGYVVKLSVPANMTKPPAGQICCDVALIGDPVP